MKHSPLTHFARILLMSLLGSIGWDGHARDSHAAVRVIPLGKTEPSVSDDKGRAPASAGPVSEGALVIRDTRMIQQTPALRNAPETRGVPLVQPAKASTRK